MARQSTRMPRRQEARRRQLQIVQFGDVGLHQPRLYRWHAMGRDVSTYYERLSSPRAAPTTFISILLDLGLIRLSWSSASDLWWKSTTAKTRCEDEHPSSCSNTLGGSQVR